MPRGDLNPSLWFLQIVGAQKRDFNICQGDAFCSWNDSDSCTWMEGPKLLCFSRSTTAGLRGHAVFLSPERAEHFQWNFLSNLVRLVFFLSSGFVSSCKDWAAISRTQLLTAGVFPSVGQAENACDFFNWLVETNKHNQQCWCGIASNALLPDVFPKSAFSDLQYTELKTWTCTSWKFTHRLWLLRRAGKYWAGAYW